MYKVPLNFCDPLSFPKLEVYNEYFKPVNVLMNKNKIKTTKYCYTLRHKRLISLSDLDNQHETCIAN